MACDVPPPADQEMRSVRYRLIAALVVAAWVGGCATARQSITDVPTAAVPEHSAAAVPVPGKPRAGSVSLDVRVAQPADAKSLSYITEGEALTNVAAWPILIGATAGAAAAPLLLAYAAYFVVGFPATVATSEGIEAGRRSVMERALLEVDFPRFTRDSITRRVGARLTATDEAAEQRAEVIVLGYGFTKRGTSDACSFATAVLRVQADDRPAIEERIAIGGLEQSPDAPPPFCSGIKRLLRDDARLARRTLAESAEVIGAIVARRLERAP